MSRRFIKGPSGLHLRPLTQDRDLELRRRLESIDMTTFDFGPDLPSESSVPSYATLDFDVTRLRGREIIIFGAGSVGGYLAWTLGVAQLKIHLFDNKKVEVKHTRSGRTIYSTDQIGQFKVNAAQAKIEHNFTGTSVVPAAYQVAEIPDGELIRRFQKVAIVMLVIDDPGQIARINRLAYQYVSIVQAGIHRQGASGHVAFTIPGQTPCLACTLGLTSPRDIHRLDSEPAAGIDISLVSQHAARIALLLMYSRITGQPVTRWRPDRNLIYVSNTREDLTPDGPGIILEGSRRRPACPVCH